MTENGERPPGRHQGEWSRCQKCGAPENNHPYRHPFKRWEPGRPTTSPGSERSE